MSWTDRRLNWVVALGGAAAFLISCIRDLQHAIAHPGSTPPWVWLFKVVAFPVLQVVEPISYGHYLWGESCYLTILLLSWAVPVLVCGWVLYRKAHSPWWMLVAWIPYVGWAVPAALDNRRGDPAAPGGDEIGCRPASRAAGSAGVPRASALALGGMAMGCAVWGGAASLFFDTVVLVAAPRSEIVRHEMGLLWFIGGCASMVVLLAGAVLGTASLGLSGPGRGSPAGRRGWSNASAIFCALCMAANVAAWSVAGRLPVTG